MNMEGLDTELNASDIDFITRVLEQDVLNALEKEIENYPDSLLLSGWKNKRESLYRVLEKLELPRDVIKQDVLEKDKEVLAQTVQGRWNLELLRGAIEQEYRRGFENGYASGERSAKEFPRGEGS